MQLTRSGEYGLKGLLFLAKRPRPGFSLVSEVSQDQKVPEKFLAKIFQRLSKAGLLQSVRGAKGGFRLGRPAREITMRAVIEAIEGPIAVNRCLLRKGECSEEDVCPFHRVFEEAQGRFLEVLDRTTMEDLAEEALRRVTQEGR